MTGLTHLRLLVDDFAPMLAFYRDVLGFKAVIEVPGVYIELDTGAARIGLCARTLMESVIGFCVGCWLFGRLMRVGVIPATTCEACSDVQARYGKEPKEVGPLKAPTTGWTARSTSQVD